MHVHKSISYLLGMFVTLLVPYRLFLVYANLRLLNITALSLIDFCEYVKVIRENLNHEFFPLKILSNRR
jgi:hypothetical protein